MCVFRPKRGDFHLLTAMPPHDETPRSAPPPRTTTIMPDAHPANAPPQERPAIAVGTRLSYNGDLCTVRYVGAIPPWSVTAYGVEWDDATRGKHSGTLNGVRYFHCRVPGAGAFLKSLRKPDDIRTFEDAVREKYIRETDPSTLTIRVSASKVVETYGAEKMVKRQAQLDKLETAFLIKMQIGDESDKDLVLQSLKHLNLGYNLFTRAQSIVDICSRLPQLEVLVLNGNRIENLDCSGTLSVQELSLSNTLTRPEDIPQWAKIAPTCQMLTLAFNSFTAQLDLRPFKQVKVLDISYNQLAEIPLIPDSVNICILAHNEIKTLPQGISYPSITTLDLSYNRIDSWDVVDSLHLVFPSVVELRLNSNLLAVKSDDESEADNLLFIFILARWGGPRLSKLDGMSVSDREQLDAELYFMSKVGSLEIPYDQKLPRWQALCQLHGQTSAKPIVKDSVINTKVLLLNISYDGRTRQIKALKTMTVQKLKAIIARTFKIPGLPSNITITYKHDMQEFLIDNELAALSFYDMDPEATLFIS